MRRRLSHRTTALLAIGLLGAGAATTASSGAFFASAHDNPGNTINAGDLNLTDSATVAESEVLDAAGLRIGQSRSGEIVVGEDGSLQGSLVLDAVNVHDASGAPLSDSLTLRVERCSDVTGPCDVATTDYDGTLADLHAVLGAVGPGDKRRYRLTLTWPTAADDVALEGGDTTFDFRWSLRS